MHIIAQVPAQLFGIIVLQRGECQQVGTGKIDTQALYSHAGKPVLLIEGVTYLKVFQAQIISLCQPE